MKGIPESDWRVFRDLHGTLMKRFFGRVLDEVSRAISNTRLEPSERFFAISKLVRERGKDATGLADHRRSTAFLVIVCMHNRENLFLPEEFQRFSQQTRDEIIGLRDL